MRNRAKQGDLIHILKAKNGSPVPANLSFRALCGKGGYLDRVEPMGGRILEAKGNWPFEAVLLSGDLTLVTCRHCIALKDEFVIELKKQEIAQGLRCASCDHGNTSHIEEEGLKHYGQVLRFPCNIDDCSCQGFADARFGLEKGSWVDGTGTVGGGLVKGAVVGWVAGDIIENIGD